MTVKELIEKLRAFPERMTVVCSDDDELNGTHECFDPELIVQGDGEEVVVL